VGVHTPSREKKMVNKTRTVLLVTALIGLVSSAPAEPPTMGDKVVKFCKDKLGEKVGDGECSSLAAAGVAQSGGRIWTAFKDSPKQGDYVWGSLVYVVEMKGDSPVETKDPKMSVKPGDIIQLRDVKFQGKNYFMTYAHHTSVVLDVNEEAKVLTVLEQNVNGKKIVMESKYHLNDLKTGWVRIYRPVPK
jgi:hypothetical protein